MQQDMTNLMSHGRPPSTEHAWGFVFAVEGTSRKVAIDLDLGLLAGSEASDAKDIVVELGVLVEGEAKVSLDESLDIDRDVFAGCIRQERGFGEFVSHDSVDL